ncbi:hypothetical protein RHGRI_002103 [Rhododendron griersonianum]|uniref:mannan endo-1,4-beta-mannosidase n=1 Tax=Rhododendron griersonianum TaxID=479676 RepID=A0AAV6LQQ6_9ERIC|nr:hypothetical protein RHGRI_002103 [Rhododendron griersonianum]
MLDGRSKAMTCTSNSSPRVVLIERMLPTANYSPAPAALLLFVSTSSPRGCDGASFSSGDGGFELGNGSRVGVDGAVLVHQIVVLQLEGQSTGHANGYYHAGSQGFIKTSGTHFVKNGRRLNLNGFNAYWLMYMASDPTTRAKIFYFAFLQWPRYLKLQAVLTRVNSITGIAYKDDPTIFAWELMNEPRCQTAGFSERPIQDWIREMATHVKYIDGNHLLEIGLEGFYGESRKQNNPGNQVVGTDFISNNQIPGIDFATIHLYPEQWMQGSKKEEQSAFVEKWIRTHIADSNSLLKKPLLLAEFGKSSKSAGYSVGARDEYYQYIYNTVFGCIKSGGPLGGGLFWQLMASGMDSFRDGYEVVLDECPSTAAIIYQQSRRLSAIN